MPTQRELLDRVKQRSQGLFKDLTENGATEENRQAVRDFIKFTNLPYPLFEERLYLPGDEDIHSASSQRLKVSDEVRNCMRKFGDILKAFSDRLYEIGCTCTKT